MNRSDLISIRPYEDTDKSFIFATWLRGLYYGDSWFHEIKKSVFMINYHKVLESLLKHKTTIIYIACLKDDPGTILGYSVVKSDNATLHWVFVKKPWRSIGIAKSLIPATVSSVTHLTKTGLGLLKKHPTVDFNPFLVDPEYKA